LTSITIGPSYTGLRGTQLTGSINYTLVTCSVDGAATSGRKRKASRHDHPARGFSSCAATAVVAGAWVKSEKKLKYNHEMLVMNLKASDGEHLRISAPDLVRTNDLDLARTNTTRKTLICGAPIWASVAHLWCATHIKPLVFITRGARPHAPWLSVLSVEHLEGVRHT
jgi:hypothetical protein